MKQLRATISCTLRRHALAGLLLIGSNAVCLAASGDEDTATLAEKARIAFWVGDFVEIERLTQLSRAPKSEAEVKADLAYQQRRQVRNGLNGVLGGYKGDGELYRAELDALTLEWARKHPTSATAHILHAGALLEHAWAYRGGGFANTVTPQAWADFERYLRRAAEYLNEHGDVAFTDSDAHLALIRIGRGLSWPTSKLWSIAQAGLKVDPQNLGLYYAVLTSTLPKWQGSTDEVEGYIREVLTLTKPTRGMEMYARLYSAAADEHYSHNLFTSSRATWPKMKAGFEDMLKRNADPDTRNAFAYFACMAKDRPVFLEQIEALGDREPEFDAWGNNARYTYEACKRWGNET